ncbi:MAG: pantoate--beta-alanine ligase [Microbacteriaceae bacterium]|nr:pantoate--beta-alanine ligase [Microbacteriaceae bacterium]
MRIALVPTLGALHDGHFALVRRAREVADLVVVSIFVNPLQFGPTEDLDRYPRTLEADVAQLEQLGVDWVFAPSVAEMYPSGTIQTRVTAGEVGSLYEGRTRTGHFDGVLTVVSKLLNIAQPDVAVFGQKDAQQVFLVKRMVADLNLPVTVEVVQTVREQDGLALSSRNRFLDAKEKRAALGLSIALEAAESSADRGIDAVLAAAQSVLMGESMVQLDYLKVVNPETFLPVDDGYQGKAVVLVAARVGTTRLIDNETIFLRGVGS